MSEAPERIWAWPSERGWYAAECSYEVNLGLLTPECDLQTDYIRADIHEDYIKDWRINLHGNRLRQRRKQASVFCCGMKTQSNVRLAGTG